MRTGPPLAIVPFLGGRESRISTLTAFLSHFFRVRGGKGTGRALPFRVPASPHIHPPATRTPIRQAFPRSSGNTSLHLCAFFSGSNRSVAIFEQSLYRLVEPSRLVRPDPKARNPHLRPETSGSNGTVPDHGAGGAVSSTISARPCSFPQEHTWSILFAKQIVASVRRKRPPRSLLPCFRPFPLPAASGCWRRPAKIVDKALSSCYG